MNLWEPHLSLAACATATIMIVGIGGTLTWGELVYVQRCARRRESFRARGGSRLSSFEARAAVGLALALALIVSAWITDIRFVLVLGLALVTASFARSTTFGREGSDEIALVIVIPLALATMPGATARLTTLAFLFIAAQLALSYAASGGAKLAGRKWRDGRAVAQILSTRDYGVGRRELYHSEAFPLRALAWGTILLELALPILLLLGGPLVVPVAIIGVVFHVSVAMAMGLNRFLPWFLSAYPAAIWASSNYGLLSP